MSATRSVRRGTRAAGAVVLAVALMALAACQSAEDKLASHYKRGQELLEQGDPAKAAVEFKNALQVDEDHLGALYGLAQSEEKQQHWRETAELLRRIVDIDPEHFGANLELCRFRFLGGDPAGALRYCEAAAKVQPDDAPLLALEAAIRLKQGDDERATELANKALAKDEANADAAIVLAAEALKAGHPKEALERLQKGLTLDERNVGLQVFNIQVLQRLGDEAGAEDALRKLSGMYRDNKAIRMSLVRFLILHKKIDAAEAELRALAKELPDDTAASLDVVRFLNTYRGGAAAEQELRAMVAAHGDNSELSQALAELLWQHGKKDEARAIDQSLIDGGKVDAVIPAKLHLARTYLADKMTDKAEALVGEVLAQDRHNVGALVMRASLQAQRAAYKEAIADLRIARDEQPDDPGVMLALGEVYELSGSIDLADEQFAAAANVSKFAPDVTHNYVSFLLRHGKARQAEDVLNRVLEGRPDDVDSLTQLAQLRLNRGDWDGAQALGERLAKLDADKGQSQQILGAALGGKAKLDESIDILRQAQQADPDAVQPLVALVNAYVHAGKEDLAMGLLRSIVQAHPERSDAQVILGALLARAGKPDEARAAFESAIQESPGKPDGYSALGSQLAREGKQDEALAVVEQGLGRIPDNPTLLLFKAAVLESQGKIDEAIDIYRRMHDLQPGSLVVANNLASLLADNRDDAESLDEAYRLALRLRDTQVPQFKDTLGWAQYRHGERDAAVTLLREAAESPNPLPIYHYHLGLAYADKGLTKLAQEQLNEALKLAEKQPFPFADKARQVLAQLDEEPAEPAKSAN